MMVSGPVGALAFSWQLVPVSVLDRFAAAQQLSMPTVGAAYLFWGSCMALGFGHTYPPL